MKNFAVKDSLQAPPHKENFSEKAEITVDTELSANMLKRIFKNAFLISLWSLSIALIAPHTPLLNLYNNPQYHDALVIITVFSFAIISAILLITAVLSNSEEAPKMILYATYINMIPISCVISAIAIIFKIVYGLMAIASISLLLFNLDYFKKSITSFKLYWQAFFMVAISFSVINMFMNLNNASLIVCLLFALLCLASIITMSMSINYIIRTGKYQLPVDINKAIANYSGLLFTRALIPRISLFYLSTAIMDKSHKKQI